jgi:hypothetical protein
MDNQSIINMALGTILLIAGWFARELWVAVKELKNDVHDLEVTLPVNYIRRDEFHDNMREIKEMLYKIFERLDNKADR